MESFGERMRREREMRGITLEAISEKTKITTRTLKALEKDEFDKLPGGIFNKGFVRSYAQFLGMNEEKVLNEFIAAAGDPEQPLPDPPVKRQEVLQPRDRRSWTSRAIPVIAAAIVIGVGWKIAPRVRRAAGSALSRVLKAKAESVRGSSTAYASSAPIDPQKQPGGLTTSSLENGASGVAQPSLQTATLQPATQTLNGTTSAPALVPASATTRNEKFFILVKAVKPAWVSITADGKPAIAGMLKKKKKIRAYSQVVLTTNNAGALAISRNGLPLTRLGEEDQQTTVTFTPDGVSR